jgi:eukaryotic-like serine/threonine-protein kinase
MAAADRHLLLGLLALQNGLINHVQLLAAFQAWALDKSRGLAEHLQSRGDLTGSKRALLEALAEVHLQAHGGDVEQSLSAVSAGKSTRKSLADLRDPDINATLGRVASTPNSTENDDADRTTDYFVGTATSNGQRFRIVRPHARGGLGVVFLALDSELNREVALKQIVEQHADDPFSRERFIAEAEITGALEHPGVVPVYGLGVDAVGRPYYAMRFINGDSLKAAIAQFHEDQKPRLDAGRRSLELRKLLRRFVDVCNAIDYAHSRGVIHRDIKPANIILGRHGETIVVDWGLAKSVGRTDPSTGEQTIAPSSSGSSETLPGSALGTPAYMSPEQARGDLTHVSPRSDIYSLGATLYCLLTGKPPYEGEDVGAILNAAQAGRFPRPSAIDPSLDKALEAVCSKAMALGPEDRYASPRLLADDIERWMADEPVTAFKEPFSWRARRWAKRNRTVVTAAAVALVLGVFGLSALAVQQMRSNAALKRANDETLQALEQAREARDAAAAALTQSQRSRKEAEAALAQSEESRKQAEAVGNFMVDSLKTPYDSAEGKDVKVADLLDQAAKGLETGFRGSKPTEAALLDALGRGYYGLGLYPKSEEIFRKALAKREAILGPSHRETLRTAALLGMAIFWSGRYDEARALLEETLRRQTAAYGTDDDETLQRRLNLSFTYESLRDGKAIEMTRQVLAAYEAKLGRDHPTTLGTRHALGRALWYGGRYAEAIAIYEELLKAYKAKGADGLESIQMNLAVAYVTVGRNAEAIALLEPGVKAYESQYAPNHLGTLNARRNLAWAYESAGRYLEAINHYEDIIALSDLKLGPDNDFSAGTGLWLARACLRFGSSNEPFERLETMAKKYETKRGPLAGVTISLRESLAAAYETAGRAADAVSVLQSLMNDFESKGKSDDPHTLSIRDKMAQLYEGLGHWSDAEVLRRDTLARNRKREKLDSPLVDGDLALLGRNLVKQEKWSAAEPILRECLAIREKTMPDNWLRFNSMALVGASLLGQAKYADAEPLLVAGYQGMLARAAVIPEAGKFNLYERGERLVRLYKAWGKPELAREWAAKLGLTDLPADVFASPERPH